MTKPPRAASAIAGSSMLEPFSVCTPIAKSWAKAVENTKGAPSTGSTREGFARQKTWFASTARSGGKCALSTAGRATTNTDLGLRKEGGLLSFRFGDRAWAMRGREYIDKWLCEDCP